MPLDFERITLNAIPDGEMPVFHASQFETMRPFIADLKWGIEDFPPGEGCWCTLAIRKTDDTLVILDDIDIDNNTVSCVLSQQSVACIGDNLCQLKVWATEDDEDKCIACLNFILHVQPDPEAGGLTSESEINNLTQQIEEITQQVMGNDYYNKTEVDDLLDDKADKSTTYTKTQVDDALDLKADKATTYTKTQVDSALALKADASTTYTKTEVDNALALKANSSDLATVATTGDYDDLLNKPSIPAAQVQSDWDEEDVSDVSYIQNKPDINGMIADAIYNVFPTKSASGAIANFTTALSMKLVSCTVDAEATTITACGVNLFDKTQLIDQVAWNIITLKLAPNTKYTMSSNISYAKTAELPLYFLSSTTNPGSSTLVYSGQSITVTTNNDGIGKIQQRRVSGSDNFQNYKWQIEQGESETAYEAYNGTTYPISDKDSIVTSRGVNNIFTDSGDITVHYKDTTL